MGFKRYLFSFISVHFLNEQVREGLCQTRNIQDLQGCKSRVFNYSGKWEYRVRSGEGTVKEICNRNILS